jgi:hypothetical protein
MAVGDSAPRSRSRRWWVRIPPKGEDFFEGRKLRRAMDVCVCLVGVDGRVVEGRSTLFRPPWRGQHGFESRREKAPMGV